MRSVGMYIEDIGDSEDNEDHLILDDDDDVHEGED